MTSAIQIVEDAFAIVLADEGDAPVEPNDLALGVRFLNDLAAELEGQGVYFNYTPVTNPDDLITSPPTANSGLKYALAPRLADIVGLSYTSSDSANSAISSLTNMFLKLDAPRFPSTMPRGSGNRNVDNGRFTYPSSLAAGSLSSTTSQTVTISTVDTPVKIAGTWIVDRTSWFTGTTDGRLTFDGVKRLALIEVNLTTQAAGSDQFTFYATKNGALLGSGVVLEADATRNVFLRCAEPLVTDDYIEIFVANNSDTTDLVTDKRTLRIT
jgi:hypothetical protein